MFDEICLRALKSQLSKSVMNSRSQTKIHSHRASEPDSRGKGGKIGFLYKIFLIIHDMEFENQLLRNDEKSEKKKLDLRELGY